MANIPQSLQPPARAATLAPIPTRQDLQNIKQDLIEEPVTLAPSIDSDAQKLAIDWINRKSRGQRIVRVNYTDPSDPRLNEIYSKANKIYKELGSNPEIRSALDRAAELKGTFLEERNELRGSYGFTPNFNEYIALKIKEQKDILKDPIAPTAAEEELQMSLPSDIRQSTPQEVRRGQSIKELPTLAEQSLLMSLPQDQRYLPTSDVQAQATITQLGTTETPGVMTRVKENIPIAGVPITLLEQSIYAPDKKTTDEIQRLIKSKKPGAARDLRILLRNKELQRQQDIRRYEALLQKENTREGLSNKDIEQLNRLSNRINLGQRGTLKELLVDVTDEAAAKGENIKILGKEFDPISTRRALLFSSKAASTSIDILPFVTGGTAIGAGLAGTAIGRGLQFVSPLANTIFTGASIGAGIGETIQLTSRGEQLGDAFAQGAGTTFGLLSPFALSSISGIKVRSPRQIAALASRPVRVGGLGKRAETYQMTVKGKRSKFDRELLKENLKKLQNEAPRLSKRQKIDRIKDLYRGVDKSKPGWEKKFRDFIEKLYGKEAYKDFYEQEIGILEGNVVRETIKPTESSIYRGQSTYAGLGVYEVTTGGQIPRTDTRVDTRSITDFNLTTDTIQQQEQENFTSSLLGINLQTDTTQESTQRTQPRLASNLISEQEASNAFEAGQFTGSVFRRPTTQRPGRPRVPRTPRIRIPGFERDERRVRKEELIGYNAYALEQGKYKKLNEKPRTKEGALDIVARVVDNTLSAQGKIEKIKQTKTKKGKKRQSVKIFQPGELVQGDGYYFNNVNKFRDYNISKGRKIKSPNRIIEKRNRRADTRGETLGLNIAQYKARARNRIFGF